MAAGSLTLGGNMSIALGPLGRNGEASGSLSTSGKMAAMYFSCSVSPDNHLILATGTATRKHGACLEGFRLKVPSSLNDKMRTSKPTGLPLQLNYSSAELWNLLLGQCR
jgi:lipid-binding SYLF domain-containing protein